MMSMRVMMSRCAIMVSAVWRGYTSVRGCRVCRVAIRASIPCHFTVYKQEEQWA
jgi:hypothetical protein